MCRPLARSFDLQLNRHSGHAQARAHTHTNTHVYTHRENRERQDTTTAAKQQRGKHTERQTHTHHTRTQPHLHITRPICHIGSAVGTSPIVVTLGRKTICPLRLSGMPSGTPRTRQAGKHTGRKAHIQACKQTSRQAGKQTGRHAGRQTEAGKQGGRQASDHISSGFAPPSSQATACFLAIVFWMSDHASHFGFEKILVRSDFLLCLLATRWRVCVCVCVLRQPFFAKLQNGMLVDIQDT